MGWGGWRLPLPPDLALDWELDSDEDMDSSFAFLEVIEEDFHHRVKAACPKTKGRKEILNLSKLH